MGPICSRKLLIGNFIVHQPTFQAINIRQKQFIKPVDEKLNVNIIRKVHKKRQAEMR